MGVCVGVGEGVVYGGPHLNFANIYIHFEIQIKQNKNVLCRILMWIYHSE